MCSIKTLRLVLIPFLISVFGEINVHAGSYILPGYGGGGLTVYQFDPITEQVTISSVPPPTSITVQIDYDPGGLGPEYGNSYGATYYQPNFDFQISGTGSPLWPGYSVSLPVSVEISAPPPGGGLESDYFPSRFVCLQRSALLHHSLCTERNDLRCDPATRGSRCLRRLRRWPVFLRRSSPAHIPSGRASPSASWSGSRAPIYRHDVDRYVPPPELHRSSQNDPATCGSPVSMRPMSLIIIPMHHRPHVLGEPRCCFALGLGLAWAGFFRSATMRCRSKSVVNLIVTESPGYIALSFAMKALSL